MAVNKSYLNTMEKKFDKTSRCLQQGGLKKTRGRQENCQESTARLAAGKKRNKLELVLPAEGEILVKGEKTIRLPQSRTKQQSSFEQESSIAFNLKEAKPANYKRMANKTYETIKHS